MAQNANFQLPLTRGRGFPIVAGVLVLILALLFGRAVFTPHFTVFSNDGPLGILMSHSHRVAEIFTGGWEDLNSVGFRHGGAVLSVTYGLQFALGPLWFSKVYAPLAISFLGFGAWFCFRKLRFAPLAGFITGFGDEKQYRLTGRTGFGDALGIF